ncbi:MAG: hypothetical protein ACAH80_11175 [Alphaproteobacteria bacterium]
MKPLDILARRARRAGRAGFVAFATGILIIPLLVTGMVLRMKGVPEFCALLLFICLPFAALSWFFWNGIRCPKCKARLWALFFHKGKFFSGPASATKCTACGVDLSLPMK